MAWKTVVDLLREEGVNVKYPRETLKEAYKKDLLNNGELWLDMLSKRNLMAHTYDEDTARIALDLIINEYFDEHQYLLKSLEEE